MKAANHRKRHVPPGPCGIWFQAQVQLSIQNSHERDNPFTTNKSGSGSRRKSSSSQQECSMRGPGNSQDDQSQRSLVIDDMSFSLAWTAAQQELNLVTPYLPPTLSSPADRHRLLRPHIPSEYALLFELQRGDHESFLEASSISKTILAMVVNVESHIHHNIWTVELKDETSSIKAWMEPTLVQQQLRQTNTIIRPGVVWKLDRVGMIFVREEEERIERMLLLRGSAIQQVWTPEQVTQNHGEDTPEQQKAFLDWLERRKALPLGDIDDDGENDDDQDCPEPDEADYPDRADEAATLGHMIPRRLAEEEDEAQFEASNLSGVLGRQPVAPTKEPTRQPQSNEPRDLPSASVPTQESNWLITQENINYIHEGTTVATPRLGTQPTTEETQPSHDAIHLHHQPKSPHGSSSRPRTHESSSQKRPRSPKRTPSPKIMKTAWSTGAPNSSFWNSMLDDQEVDSECDSVVPSPEVASQPPTVTTQHEGTIKSTLENLGEADEASDCDGRVSHCLGTDVR